MDARIRKQTMNKFRVAVIAPIILLIIMAGCASQPPLLPITNPEQRYEFNGFSVLPPKGTGWNWVGREGQNKRDFFNTTFAKMDGDRTYLAKAELLNTQGMSFTNLEELIEELKTWNLFKEGPRQVNMKLDMKIDSAIGNRCVRFDFEAEDHQIPGRPGAIFDIDTHGFYCLHPKADNVLAQIIYSRRTPKGQPYVADITEGERFIHSVEFTNVRN